MITILFIFIDRANAEIYALSVPCVLFFFNDTATTEIYTLSLHDALPISEFSGLGVTEISRTVCELLEWKRPNGKLKNHECRQLLERLQAEGVLTLPALRNLGGRSEEHTSELQSQSNLVCRLLLEKKKNHR